MTSASSDDSDTEHAAAASHQPHHNKKRSHRRSSYKAYSTLGGIGGFMPQMAVPFGAFGSQMPGQMPGTQPAPIFASMAGHQPAFPGMPVLPGFSALANHYAPAVLQDMQLPGSGLMSTGSSTSAQGMQQQMLHPLTMLPNVSGLPVAPHSHSIPAIHVPGTVPMPGMAPVVAQPMMLQPISAGSLSSSQQLPTAPLMSGLQASVNASGQHQYPQPPPQQQPASQAPVSLHPFTSAPPAPPVQLPITLQPPALFLSHDQFNQSASGRPLLWDATLGQCVPGDDEALLRELQAAGHVLMHVVDACRARAAALQAAVNGPLLTRRGQLLQHHARLGARATEIAATRSTLEREARAMLQEMLERLRSAEAGKASQLAAAQAEVVAEVGAIDALITSVCVASSQQQQGPEEPGAAAQVFLAAAGPLEEECTRLAAKPLPETPPVPADDLPAEARGLQRLSESQAQLVQLLGVKDSLIWQLLKQRDELAAQASEVAAAYRSEIQALDQQCEELRAQLAAVMEGATQSSGMQAAWHQPLQQAARVAGQAAATM